MQKLFVLTVPQVHNVIKRFLANIKHPVTYHKPTNLVGEDGTNKVQYVATDVKWNQTKSRRNRNNKNRRECAAHVYFMNKFQIGKNIFIRFKKHRKKRQTTNIQNI